MMREKEIRDILKGLSYLVVVQQTAWPDQCVTYFPNAKFGDKVFSSEHMVYSIDRNEIETENKQDRYVSISYTSAFAQKSIDRNITIPEYSVRPLILCDIIKNCMKRKFPASYIQYKDANGNSDGILFEDIINEPSREEDIEREQHMQQVVHSAFADGYWSAYETTAQQLNVLYGFKLARKILED